MKNVFIAVDHSIRMLNFIILFVNWQKEYLKKVVLSMAARQITKNPTQLMN